MGPGYVVAVLLEVAGLSGVVVAALVMRTERKARVAELRSFLRSGQTSVAAPIPVARNRWLKPAPRVVIVPVAAQARRVERLQDSVARSALSRAFPRPGATATGKMAVSISAG